MSLTIADARAEQLDAALRATLRAIDRWKIVEQELASARAALDVAAEALYDALLDPEATRDDEDAEDAEPDVAVVGLLEWLRDKVEEAKPDA
jgi:hypothetical protein